MKMGLGHRDGDIGMCGQGLGTQEVGVNVSQAPLRLHSSHDFVPNLKILEEKL